MEKSFSDRVAEAKAEVSAISAEEASKRKASEPEVLFIDPRNADDIRATTGIIPGALNVPLNELNEKSDDDLPEELGTRSRTIIAACQGGPMGALAAHALKRRGFQNVYFMDGGTQGWIDAGYTTAR